FQRAGRVHDLYLDLPPLVVPGVVCGLEAEDILILELLCQGFEACPELRVGLCLIEASAGKSCQIFISDAALEVNCRASTEFLKVSRGCTGTRCEDDKDRDWQLLGIFLQ